MSGEIVCYIMTSVYVAHMILLPFKGHIAEFAGDSGERYIMYLSQMSRHICLAYRFVTVGALEF